MYQTAIVSLITFFLSYIRTDQCDQDVASKKQRFLYHARRAEFLLLYYQEFSKQVNHITFANERLLKRKIRELSIILFS